MILEKYLKWMGALQGGLTGKGIKIASFEYNASDWLYKNGVTNPLNMTSEDMLKLEPRDFNHIFRTTRRIKTVAPGAEVVFLPQTDAGLDYALKNGFHLAVFSGGNFIGSDDKEKKLAENTFMVMAAGNNGNETEHGEKFSTLNPWWHVVGAVRLDSNDNPVQEYYSAWGNGKVKNTCLTSFPLDDEYPNIAAGTSMSAPADIGLRALVMEDFRNKFGFLPTPSQLAAICKRMYTPVCNDPLREGYGIFRLPDLSKFDYGMTIKMGSKEINVNGVKKELESSSFIVEKDKPLPADAMNFSYVKPTALRELGFKVDFNAKTREVVVLKL